MNDTLKGEPDDQNQTSRHSFAEHIRCFECGRALRDPSDGSIFAGLISSQS